jgi:transcriptional regulator with XRE-family HTH domain
MKVTSQQLRAARALLDWTSGDLARTSGVSEPTIWRLEAVRGLLGGRPETAEKLIRALEAAGVEFLDHGQPGVRLRKHVVAEAEHARAPKLARAKKTRQRRS